MERYERLGWLAALRFGGKLPDGAHPIEPWLREPRRLNLVDQQGRPLSNDTIDFVRRARATVGVVVSAEEKPAHEGSDFDLRVLFNDGARPALYRFQSGYDTQHWWISSREHYVWFHAVLREKGMPLTMLYDPDAGTATPFGQLEPFLPLSVADLLGLVALQPAARKRRLYEAVDVLIAVKKKAPARFRELAGPVMKPLVGPSIDRWTSELARRIRLDESPEEPLEALARAMPDERAAIWATL
jgi:hypothetical protein